MQDTQTAIPSDLLNAMQRYAEFINLLMSGSDSPGSRLLFELRDALAAKSAQAFREVVEERDLEAERQDRHEYDNETTEFLVLMAQMNGLAQVIGHDLSASTYNDKEAMCVPDPMWWYDGLRGLRSNLKPYLHIADDALRGRGAAA